MNLLLLALVEAVLHGACDGLRVVEVTLGARVSSSWLRNIHGTNNPVGQLWTRARLRRRKPLSDVEFGTLILLV